ncbi:hypothetical protein KY290_015154 [Solanum tuberosum]|uniref:Uncharacterized protein n=1 Tax=Solanum tuberosum TaxID=4113 RepID=A0ABQ7VRU5_SOLTU|nr:hypothetical protein KY284_014508 [Solanum tuberosum]KAH0718515.1 hypothetical protein KY285_014546 [Solanum tuberosum]KAH0771173.1 hypothetical protein KY290_015154 [Solanum tuberosum]
MAGFTSTIIDKQANPVLSLFQFANAEATTAMLECLMPGNSVCMFTSLNFEYDLLDEKGTLLFWPTGYSSAAAFHLSGSQKKLHIQMSPKIQEE